MEEKLDKELIAINQIMKALQDLDPGARKRVLDYTLERLGVKSDGFQKSEEVEDRSREGLVREEKLGANAPSKSGQTNDIRSLRNEKSPKSAIQMAALVAYYLQELAPDGERKDFVEPKDVTKYFKQAQFKLPTGKNGPFNTLSNAKNAGYLDPGRKHGTYKLNPVGFNLIVHGLSSQKKK